MTHQLQTHSQTQAASRYIPLRSRIFCNTPMLVPSPSAYPPTQLTTEMLSPETHSLENPHAHTNVFHTLSKPACHRDTLTPKTLIPMTSMLIPSPLVHQPCKPPIETCKKRKGGKKKKPTCISSSARRSSSKRSRQCPSSRTCRGRAPGPQHPPKAGLRDPAISGL